MQGSFCGVALPAVVLPRGARSSAMFKPVIGDVYNYLKDNIRFVNKDGHRYLEAVSKYSMRDLQPGLRKIASPVGSRFVYRVAQ